MFDNGKQGIYPGGCSLEKLIKRNLPKADSGHFERHEMDWF